MNKAKLQKLYFWIQKRMTEDERKLVAARNKSWLESSKNELGIDLNAKISGMIDFLVTAEMVSR